MCGRKKLPFAEYSVVKDHSGGKYHPAESFGDRGVFSPGTPFAHSLAGPQSPTPLVRAVGDRFDHRQKISKSFEPSGRAGVSGVPARPGARQSRAFNDGGEYRARTGDLLVANQALSQLS